jgi:alkylation response protein AidB-like acyl-CoA dehydrogenase
MTPSSTPKSQSASPSANDVAEQQPGDVREPDLSPDDAAFRDELRQWLSEHLVGEYKKAKGVGGPADDTAWDLRMAWEKELATGRWLNVSWPVEYGGRGGTPRQELIFHIEHASAGAPYWVGVHGRDLFGPTLLEYGTEEQRRRFLPAITRVEEFWGQGFSEPNAGSDLAGLRTRAERDGDEWVVTGQKVWTTFGAYANWLYVLCRTDPEEPRHKGISMLLIPVDQPGVDVRTIRTMAGSREFCEIFLDEARTPVQNIVGTVNGGWEVVMGTLGNERGGSTVLPFQAMFAREMRQLLALAHDRGLARDPVLRDRLARAWAGLRILELNNDRLLSAVLAGRHPGPESSITKLYWSTWHRQFGELMMDSLGPAALCAVPDRMEPNGTADDLADAMARSFLNSRAETIYGGSVEIQRNILAERVLGLPR